MWAMCRGIMVGGLLAGVAIGCRGDQALRGDATVSLDRPEITAAALRDGTFPSQYVEEGAVRLSRGMFEDTARRVTVFFQPEYAAGDLDGDGQPDAAIVLSTNTGGSGTFQDLVVVLNGSGPVRGAADFFLGDRVQVDRIRIADGEIRLDLTMHGPGDPMCCPTLPATRRFRLIDGELREFGLPAGAPEYLP